MWGHLGRRAAGGARVLAAIARGEQPALLALAAGIGIAAGLSVTVFYRFIDLVHALALRGTFEIGAVRPLLAIPVVVLIGLALARAFVVYGARGSEGENVPDVMYRVNTQGGTIPFRPVLFKTLAAGTLIGTGGSVGAEGPVIVAGAATASRIGRWLRVSPNRLRTLAGCGAAAGLSAAFNAPIAGVIFGVEKILGATGDVALGPFVVASIMATAVSRSVFGNQPFLALAAPSASGAPWEFGVYLALGLACGLVGVAYARGVWTVRDRLAGLADWQRLAFAAVVVGGLGMVFRQDLWGLGHEVLDVSIIERRGAGFLLGLAAAKLVATAVTLAAAGAGGVFAPALFIGATVGGAAGVALHAIAPESGIAPAALAMVGMAGVVSGATHAPLTAIMMVFEMTGDYELILPLMLTGVVAYVVARRLAPESIYTEWLARRGIHLTHGADAAILARIPVSECANRTPVAIAEDAGVPAIRQGLAAANQRAVPVVGRDGRLRGMIVPAEIRDALLDPGLSDLAIAADLAVPRYEALTLDDSLLTALRLFGRYDVDVLPVLAARDSERLAGTITRQEAWAVYERHLLEAQEQGAGTR